MSRLEILRWPDPRLTEVCAPVDDFSELADLVGDMFETMYAAPGRGLAAPQVGRMVRVFVMDVGWKEGDMTPLACVNPQIHPVAGVPIPGEEGCLSVPGVMADVARLEEVILKYTDLNGEAQELRLTGAAARIAQHECDHLDGTMHFDRLTAEGRAALLALYESLP